jgi:hypothetical protein
MPLLSNHSSNEYTKLLCIGNPGSGKSGGLCPLVAAGYKLRILDMDNGLEVLKNYILKECPDKIGNVEYRSLRDKRKASADGPVIAGTPRAFPDALKMLDRWKYDDVDLGPPAEWGPECILVVDTLTFLSHAAFDFREPLTPRSRDGKYDQRATYRDAQDAIRAVLGTLYSEAFETNVIVNTHIKYQEREDGQVKGFPTSVGSALGPEIGIYFNTIALFETDNKGNHVIRTVPTNMIDLKNPKPFAMAKTYPLETGLADIFEVLRGKPETKPKPKLVTRRV